MAEPTGMDYWMDYWLLDHLRRQRAWLDQPSITASENGEPHRMTDESRKERLEILSFRELMGKGPAEAEIIDMFCWELVRSISSIRTDSVLRRLLISSGVVTSEVLATYLLVFIWDTISRNGSKVYRRIVRGIYSRMLESLNDGEELDTELLRLFQSGMRDGN